MMKQMMYAVLKGIAPMVAVGVGVLLAAKPEVFFSAGVTEEAAPMVQRVVQQAPVLVAPSASPAAQTEEVPPPYVLELHTRIDALRAEIAALKVQRASAPSQEWDADAPLRSHNPDENPNVLAGRILAAQQQAKDELQQFAHRYAAATIDSDWTQRLQVTVGNLESEIAGTELGSVAVTQLECRDVGCEIQVAAKDVPSDIVSLMVEAQLGGEGYIQDVIAMEEGKLRLLVARRG